MDVDNVRREVVTKLVVVVDLVDMAEDVAVHAMVGIVVILVVEGVSVLGGRVNTACVLPIVVILVVEPVSVSVPGGRADTASVLPNVSCVRVCRGSWGRVCCILCWVIGSML